MTGDLEADEPTVELVEDGPPPRHPARWPQLALLGTAVVVVIVVGLLDRGGDDETSLPTTTTTSLPRFENGDGPLLPDAVDTAVLTVGPTGLVTVHDLASGSRCVNAAGGQDTWIPFPSRPITSTVALQTDNRLTLVDSRCTLRPIAINDGYPVAMTDDAVWYMQDDGQVLREVRLDGRAGRRVDAPANVGPVLAAGDRLVLTAAGSMTLVDPATGARRDLGTGQAIAATRSTVAVLSCPRLQCRLSMLDLASGRRRALADPRLGVVGGGTFSPDGTRFVGATMQGKVVAVDLRDGSTADLDADQPIGFTADSSWVLVQSTGNVIAIRPDGTNRKLVANIGTINSVAVVHTPRDY